MYPAVLGSRGFRWCVGKGEGVAGECCDALNDDGGPRYTRALLLCQRWAFRRPAPKRGSRAPNVRAPATGLFGVLGPASGTPSCGGATHAFRRRERDGPRRLRARILVVVFSRGQGTLSESNNEDPGPHDLDRADSRVSGDGLPPWPAAVPPFLYLQSPHYSSYPEALFPYEGGSLIDRQGNIFDLVHSAWFDHPVIGPWNEYQLHENTYMHQDLGYAPSPPPFRPLGMNGVDESCADEPHTTVPDTIIRVSSERWGDALLDPAATFPRSGLQGW
ncbi:hypothetical protein HPB51_023977 [Rhipicephalus microplus]|uniref:Uncharacterized protein n=1 Tax=Rhipicephalus microplus TaxID=6941 RepID=A0A9J6EDW3_RHIMP|nr:hypothetical protein HPB51_023977 [Rhipicephalus microplus]